MVEHNVIKKLSFQMKVYERGQIATLHKEDKSVHYIVKQLV